MFSLFDLILIILIGIPLYVLSGFLFKEKKVPSNLKVIPSYSGYPIVGNALFKGPLYSNLFELGKKIGNGIFTYSLGMRNIVILQNYDCLSKSLKENGNVFSGRWQNSIVKIGTHEAGVLFTDKELWATQRSFLLRVLRDFGFGKQRSQDIISNECQLLMKELNELNGKVVSCRTLFPIYMVNIISKLSMDMRYEATDEKFKDLTKTIENQAQNTNFLLQLIIMFPIIDEIPFLSKLLLKISGREHALDKMHMYIKSVIDEHRSRFSPDNEGQDVIDIFLKEQYKLEQEGVKVHTFTEWQLIRITFELFVAGYETTSTTLSWSMLLLARHQDVQEKMYREIFDVIGTNRSPVLTDKKDLPYTQAVMDEVFRVSSVVPLALPHRVLENTQINDYFIPKDSVVFPNLYAIHRDKRLWAQPDNFYPEHFLVNNSDGSVKYTPRNELCPFSIGKRQCLGESLARMEFFMFLVNVIQWYKVTLPDSVSDEIYAKMTFGTDGTIRAPVGSDVIFTMRS